ERPLSRVQADAAERPRSAAAVPLPLQWRGTPLPLQSLAHRLPDREGGGWRCAVDRSSLGTAALSARRLRTLRARPDRAAPCAGVLRVRVSLKCVPCDQKSTREGHRRQEESISDGFSIHV